MQRKQTIIVAVLLVFLISISYVVYISYQMKKASEATPPDNIPYLIILGAKVNGTEMSLSLRNRSKKALEYLKANPDTIAIATGGIGSSATISEAQAVKNFLVKNGIEEDRILLEENSTSTFENLQFTKELYDVDEAVIVTSDFHLYRALRNAEANGIKGYPLAAETPQVVKVQSYIREYLANLRLVIFNR